MRLLFIRHAQSENNAVPESDRVEDPGITDIGKQQADRLARTFSQWKADRLLCSAFRRAMLTAEALRKASGLRPHVWTELHENGGCYAGHLPGKMTGRPGMNHDEVGRHFPGFTIEGQIPTTGWWSSQPKETAEGSRLRAREQAARLLATFPNDERIACVIHADFKALLLEELLGEAWLELQDEPLYNTGVTELQCFLTPGVPPQVELIRFNQVEHLTDALRTD